MPTNFGISFIPTQNCVNDVGAGRSNCIQDFQPGVSWLISMVMCWKKLVSSGMTDDALRADAEVGNGAVGTFPSMSGIPEAGETWTL